MYLDKSGIKQLVTVDMVSEFKSASQGMIIIRYFFELQGYMAFFL